MSRATDAAVEDVFFALGDRTRLGLVRRLGAGPPASATALSHGAGISRQAVVKHLRLLEDVGVVVAARRGREVCYTLEPAAQIGRAHV